MSFTILTAITRLTTGPTNCFKAGLSSSQQLQRVNEVLEKFYDKGTWRGVYKQIALTSVGGIITLPSAYQRLDGLSIPNCGYLVKIKSNLYPFQENGPHNQDWTKYCPAIAIDMGDVAGTRQYQLTGDPTRLDTFAYVGLARIRYVWATDTSTIVVPDSYQALRLGVISMGQEDELATDQAQKLFAQALQELEGNLAEFNSDFSYGEVQIDAGFGMGSVPNLV